jgi:undecaprenyl-diphosphatase
MPAAATPWEALVLGVVEGLTEFLPVSSTGHLLLTERALGMERTPALDAFTIVIQVGAIAAVLTIYRARAVAAWRGLLGRDPAGARLLVHLALAFLPAAVAGVLLEPFIEAALFGLWPVTAAWAAGGALLLVISGRLDPRRAPRAGLSIEGLTPVRALAIGCVQCAALWPGTSRSLAALLGALLVGLSLPAAVEFSFLLGVVTLGAAAGWKLLHHAEALRELGVVTLTVGLAAAAVTAGLAVRGLVAWVRMRSLAPFGWYRLGLAVVVATLLLTGGLPAG